MHPTEFDPDDNFAGAFAAEGDIDEDADVEALVWQMLLLVNPGDEEGALEQFTAFREALADTGEDIDPLELLREATDWRSTFFVGEEDPAAAVDAIDMLAGRFGLHVDWDTEDPTDPDFLESQGVGGLLQHAFEALREHHYTLWTWETGIDAVAGALTRQADDESMRIVGGVLGLRLRAGAG